MTSELSQAELEAYRAAQAERDAQIEQRDEINRELYPEQFADAEPEAVLGHDYDGPELRSGTPEYEALYAEYQAWAAQPEPEPEAGL